MGKGIPKGWIYCPKNANKLISSKFMVIKTPLSHKYLKHISSKEHFPPEEIFLKAARNNVNL